MTTEEFEKTINNARLFDINKESEQYEREREKFFKILVDYYRKYYYQNKSFDEYGARLIIVANDCLKSYNKREGVFLHYFNRAWKIDKIKQKRVKYEDRLIGLKISPKQQRLYKNIKLYAKTKNLDLEDTETQNKIVQDLKLDIHRVQECIQIHSGRGIITTIQDKDKKNISILDCLTDKKISIEDICMENESIDNILFSIDTLFEKQQERQKELLSMLITNTLCEALEDVEKCNKFSFYHNKIAMDYKQGKKYTQKEIGELCNKLPEGTNRVWKRFKDKLKENLGREI